MRPLLLCFCLALASCCWPASAEGSASTAAPARAAPAIFALHPARGSRPRTVGDDESATSFVLRGARQLRMSLFALTRRLPLLPCCGAASDDPTELLTAADIDIARSELGVSSAAAAVRSIVVGVKGSAALDAVRAQMRVGSGADADAGALLQLDQQIGSLEGGDDHLVHALNHGASGQVTLFLVGASPIAAMYSTSTALEQLGIRFHLHGDSVPRPGGRAPTLDSALEVLAKLQLLQTPSMAVRGILPFHDFAQGPDWWDLNDYMFTMEQLAKMKLNFFGLHTYQQVGDPENPGTWGNWTEPAVWTGLNSRRRDCHLMAPPCTFIRCSNSDKQGVPSNDSLADG